MDIFVGNFPFNTTEEELSEAFAEFGTVDRVHLVMDRETGRPRGFGFVTMPEAAEAKAAVEALDGEDFGGRPLRCNEARPREERPRRDHGGGGDRRGGGGRPQGGGGRRDDWGDDRRGGGGDRRGGGRGRDERPRRRQDDGYSDNY